MKTIEGFLIGLIFATFIFICISAKAENEPKIVGDNGQLVGIEIVTEEGETLCVGPHYDKTEKTLTCDH